ncbi:hypothetical protein KC957_03225 [Candidatus Saccharibacteria bacterium]|nr:hypothetical protein [Candidatus Saccharibacteria bacterium]
MGVSHLLGAGEAIAETIPCVSDQMDYDVHVLERPGLSTGDEVLLDIRSQTERLVLIGGNALELEGISGTGTVIMYDLATGERNDVTLGVGKRTQVSPNNTLYWYENSGEESFIVRDHCDGFVPEHEPSAEDVAKGVIGLLGRVFG